MSQSDINLVFPSQLGLTTVVRLNVPLIKQHEEFWCVPACIKMVLEYLNRSGMLTIPVPSFTLLEIGKIVQTQDGTRAHNVPLINSHLEQAVPSVEFVDDYKVRSVDEIEEENTARRPCICWMTLTDGHYHNPAHAVVVIDIDQERNRITFNDPGPPRESPQPLSAFQAVWERSYTTMVKLQIGKNTRTVLSQFMEKEEEKTRE